MISKHSLDVADKAQGIYDAGLRAKLETTHANQFVAIEPESGEFFLGGTYGEAVTAARTAHPDRISFVIRVGHEAAIRLGGATA
jgi:hypothetical protein